MKVTQEDLQKLKKYGFQWYKDHSTDRVEAEGIKDILPAAHGFTVVYTSDAVFNYSTATVHKIDYPDNLDNQWIRVYWDKIEDEQRD